MLSTVTSCSGLQLYSKWSLLQMFFDHNQRHIQQSPPTAVGIGLFVTLNNGRKMLTNLTQILTDLYLWCCGGLASHLVSKTMLKKPWYNEPDNFGHLIWKCFPSKTPTACGIFHNSSNGSEVLRHCSSQAFVTKNLDITVHPVLLKIVESKQGILLQELLWGMQCLIYNFLVPPVIVNDWIFLASFAYI